MNTINTFPSDYYGNALLAHEDVRALAHELSLERGEASIEGSQPWLEAEAWLRYQNSEGGSLLWS